MIKAELKYTKDHEWIRVEGNKAYIGLTDYAQKALGEIVYVDLPGVGDSIACGDSFGAVESVKAASDVYSPATGTVSEINGELEDMPSKINLDPYETWLICVDISAGALSDELMDADGYRELLGGE